MPAEVDLDARGRRLRAALAAVLVRDNTSELRLVRASSYHGITRSISAGDRVLQVTFVYFSKSVPVRRQTADESSPPVVLA
jgi:hypothetical protein